MLAVVFATQDFPDRSRAESTIRWHMRGYLAWHSYLNHVFTAYRRTLMSIIYGVGDVDMTCDKQSVLDPESGELLQLCLRSDNLCVLVAL